MDKLENVEAENKGKIFFNPLINNVLGNLPLAVFTCINSTYWIGYLFLSLGQLVVLLTLSLVNLAKKPALSGAYLLTFMVILFMWICTTWYASEN